MLRFIRTSLVATLLCGSLGFVSVKAAPDLMLAGEVETAVAQGRFDDAIFRIETALEATPGHDVEMRLDLMRRLAVVYQQVGRWEDAARFWLEGANDLANWRGAAFPELAGWYESASESFERAGMLPAALSAALSALKVDEANLGDGHVSVTQARSRVVRLSTMTSAADSVSEEPLTPSRARSQMIENLTATKSPPMPGRTRGLPGIARQSSAPVPVIDQIDVDFGEVDPSQFARVKVFYGTDRIVTGSRRPDSYYGGERGPLNWGSVDVSVPRTHKPGAIERPSLMSFDVRESPERHMVLLNLTVLEGDEALAEMRRTLQEQDSDQAFVFIHGYNVSFADAARRTAQIAYDLNFPGLPVLYSWPSRASTLDYIADTAVVRHSGRNLLRFLEELVESSGAKRIHLVGHSMGNRALTDALELYAIRHAQKEQPTFDQIVFTAPDVDAGLFAEMVQSIRPVAKRMTLYTSDQDLALSVSRRLHGSRARAGQAGEDILVMDVIDTVDMTELGEDMLGHSYFANDASALSDLLMLFTVANPPAERCGLVSRTAVRGEHWQFDPQRCDGSIWLSAVSLWQSRGPEALDYARERVQEAERQNVPRAQAEWAAITQALEQLISHPGTSGS